jgi:hypothetical protein
VASLDCFVSDGYEIEHKGAMRESDSEGGGEGEGLKAPAPALDLSELVNYKPVSKSDKRYASGLLTGEAKTNTNFKFTSGV